MINPSEFFKVAEDLANAAEGEEAVFRTSISRAYYAAYHEVADKYAAKTSTPRSDRIFENHQNFIYQLKQMQSEPKFKTLGRQLHDLKSDRNNADYKLYRDITRNTAKKSLAVSRRILSNCQGL